MLLRGDSLHVVSTAATVAMAADLVARDDPDVVLTAGSYGNVLRFLPPLVIGQDLLTEALDVLDAGRRTAGRRRREVASRAAEAGRRARGGRPQRRSRQRQPARRR